jgi:hypothetical protein
MLKNGRSARDVDMARDAARLAGIADLGDKKFAPALRPAAHLGPILT